jgi:hypothetical protein
MQLDDRLSVLRAVLQASAEAKVRRPKPEHEPEPGKKYVNVSKTKASAFLLKKNTRKTRVIKLTQKRSQVTNRFQT